MVRAARYELFYEGCYAHIISRSIRKVKLFKDEEDFDKFKRILIKAKERASFKIFHYCIMQTHFHLAVKMEGVKEFSFAMRDVKREYVYYYHTKYRLSGPLWRERYRSLLIEDERYLKACGEYIESNPVKAGLVNRTEDWKYSSSRYYKTREADALIDEYDKGEQVGAVNVDENDFEKGNVIGSGYFRYQFLEQQKKF